MKPIFFLFLISVIALSACTPSPTAAPVTPTAPEGSASPANNASPYPTANNAAGNGEAAYPGAAPALPTTNPYPEANAAPAANVTPIVIPTPTIDPRLGQVTGRLLENTKPVPNAYLYLAEVKADAKGNELAASISGGAPFAVTDENGSFHFYNIKAGRYGIVLHIVLNAYLLNVPDKEEAILFTVTDGQTTDVGDLVYDEVPTP